MELFDYLLAKKKAGGGGGSSDLDWSAIGYDSTPQGIVDGYNYAVEIKNNYNGTKFTNDKKLMYMPSITMPNFSSFDDFFKNCYSLTDVAPLTLQSSPVFTTSMFYNCYSLRTVSLFDTSGTSQMLYMFQNCYNLTTIPQFNTQNTIRMDYMFFGCTSLTTIPLLNTGRVTNMSSMFTNCTSLTDTSLDNILQMCINAIAYTGTKTLYQIGFTSNMYSVSRIEALPHYQDFINAGWTIGY